MKQHLLLFVAVTAAAAAAGCGKSSDLAPTAAEARGIAEAYQVRVAELEQRAQELVRRGGDARVESDAIRTIIPEMKGIVRDALVKIPRLVADDKLDEQQKIDELRTYSYQLEDRLATDWIKANAQLDTAEACLFRAEHRPRMQQAAAAPP